MYVVNKIGEVMELFYDYFIETAYAFLDFLIHKQDSLLILKLRPFSDGF